MNENDERMTSLTTVTRFFHLPTSCLPPLVSSSRVAVRLTGGHEERRRKA